MAVVPTVNSSQNGNLIELNEAASRGLESLGKLFAISENRNELVRQRTHQTAVTVMSSVRQGISSVTEKNLKLLEEQVIFEEENKKKEAVHQEEIKERDQEIEFYKKSLEDMRKKLSEEKSRVQRLEYLRVFQPLENVLLGISTPFNCLNGSLSNDFSTSTIRQTIFSAKPEAHLGYFAKYLQSELKDSFPNTIDPEKLPNLELWIKDCDKYLAKLRQNGDILDSHQQEQIEEIVKVGESALSFIEYVQKNKIFFDKLLSNYETHRKIIDELLKAAFTKKKNELYNDTIEFGKNCRHELVERYYGFKSSPSESEKYEEYYFRLFEKELKENIEKMDKEQIRNFRRIDYHFPPLYQTKDSLIAAASKFSHCTDSFFNYFIIPLKNQSILSTGVKPTIFYPTHFWECSNFVSLLMEQVPSEALLAEKLGLGLFYLGYETLSSTEAKIRIFLKGREGKSNLFGGKWKLFNEHVDLHKNRYISVGRASDYCLMSLLDFSTSHHYDCEGCRAYFMDLLVKIGETDLSSKRAQLSEIIENQLTRIRKEVLASVDQSVEFLQAKDGLELSSQLIKAFSTIAGLEDALSRLMIPENLEKYFEQFCEKGTDSPNILPSFKDSKEKITSLSFAEASPNSCVSIIRNQLTELHQISLKLQNLSSTGENVC